MSKSGRILAVEIDEALEVEVELDGIYIGDAQQIGHNTVGSTTPSHVEVSFAAGVFQDLPVDKEVGNESPSP